MTVSTKSASTKKVGGSEAKQTQAKPMAKDVLAKANTTKPKGKTSTSKAGETVLTKGGITLRLPPGVTATITEGGDLPKVLDGVSGFKVKSTITFSVPISLGAPAWQNPANEGADNGKKGSLGWALGNATKKDGADWRVSEQLVDRVKSAVRPLMEAVLKANGAGAAADAKISLVDGFRDALDGLIAEREKAGLKSYPDKNYYAVQIEMDDGRKWETAVHPKDLA